jgi:hypothetical protein
MGNSDELFSLPSLEYLKGGATLIHKYLSYPQDDFYISSALVVCASTGTAIVKVFESFTYVNPISACLF